MLLQKPWDRAVPPGRIGYDLAAPVLLLHSFLDGAGWDRLAVDGELRADPARTEPDYADAYAWMRAQHAARVPDSRGGPLLWLWAKTRRRDLVRMCRDYARDHPGTVLVTFRIPRDQVLLSDFMSWHDVLNVWKHIPQTGDDDADCAAVEAFFDRLEHAVPDWRSVPPVSWPAALREEIVRSWDGVFDLSRAQVVQAVAERFRLDEAVRAVRILPRC